MMGLHIHNICRACIEKRIHTVLEYKIHHTLGGHGYIPEQGWTHLQAKNLHEIERVSK